MLPQMFHYPVATTSHGSEKSKMYSSVVQVIYKTFSLQTNCDSHFEVLHLHVSQFQPTPSYSLLFSTCLCMRANLMRHMVCYVEPSEKAVNGNYLGKDRHLQKIPGR